MANEPKTSIRLVIADLDGTLIDPNKELSLSTLDSVKELNEAGIMFTLVSGRPPFGMRSYVDALRISLPFSGFNGGMITDPDFETIHKHTLSPPAAQEVARFLEFKGLSYWIYHGSDWLVRGHDVPHEDSEARNVGFSASVVTTFDDRWAGLTKLVGISDNHELLATVERETQTKFRGRVSAARSQPYYLDVTHVEANKGFFVEYLSQLYSIPPKQIATIGDMPSDVFMFRKSGLAIAMGNASDAVKTAAHHVTSSNADDGFARAMKAFVLNSALRTKSA
jgi:Cof subfamily protein (haloacid dehalogenase superfamily)